MTPEPPCDSPLTAFLGPLLLNTSFNRRGLIFLIIYIVCLLIVGWLLPMTSRRRRY